MHQISVHPHHETTFFSFRTAVKVIPAALVLVYAIYFFSAPYWIALGLLVGLGLAFAYRVKALEAVDTDSHNQLKGVVCSDGGTFRQQNDQQVTKAARPVVDGGSFERQS